MIESVAQKLEMAILSGDLKPRERLVELELSSKFNVKRFAIRKAIQELVHRGFVEFIPNKGARVVDISSEELEDLHLIRVNLELLAAELLIKRITPEKLTLIRRIQKEYSEAVESGSVEEMVLKHEAFHRTLYRMTENRFLSDPLERLTNSIFALRYNAFFLLGMFRESLAQHEAIIDALEKRDLKKLKQYTKKNMIFPTLIRLSRKMKPEPRG